MRIEDLIGSEGDVNLHKAVKKIQEECSQFLSAAQGLYLCKQLPTPTDSNSFPLQKIKVRHRRTDDRVSEAFSKAFNTNLRQRAIFTSANPPLEEGSECSYVFPINGYKFLYSKEVKNSSADYQSVLDTLFERLEDDKAVQIVTDIVKYTYVRENLVEGISSNSEIIFYGIPFYYALPVYKCPAYNQLFNQ